MSRIHLPTVVDCRGCGVCRLHLDTPPFHEYERPYVPPELLAEIDAIERHQVYPDEFGGPCLWFDREARRRKHYEERPDMCRDFQAGGDDCLRHRHLNGMRGAGS